MARDEKRGKRGRREDAPKGPPVGPRDTDKKPTDAELAELAPSQDEIERLIEDDDE